MLDPLFYLPHFLHSTVVVPVSRSGVESLSGLCQERNDPDPDLTKTPNVST